jgi:hypothetical protein
VLGGLVAIRTPIAHDQPPALDPDHLYHPPAAVADITADRLPTPRDPSPGRGLLQVEDATAVEVDEEEVPPPTTIAAVAVVPGAEAGAGAGAGAPAAGTTEGSDCVSCLSRLGCYYV